jgi:hypothetical protein
MFSLLLLGAGAALAVKEAAYDAPYDWELVKKHTNVNRERKQIDRVLTFFFFKGE